MANFCFHIHNGFGRENVVRLFLSISSSPKQVGKKEKAKKITERMNRMAKTGTNQSRLTALHTHIYTSLWQENNYSFDKKGQANTSTTNE